MLPENRFYPVVVIKNHQKLNILFTAMFYPTLKKSIFFIFRLAIMPETVYNISGVMIRYTETLNIKMNHYRHYKRMGKKIKSL